MPPKRIFEDKDSSDTLKSLSWTEVSNEPDNKILRVIVVENIEFKEKMSNVGEFWNTRSITIRIIKQQICILHYIFVLVEHISWYQIRPI